MICVLCGKPIDGPVLTVGSSSAHVKYCPPDPTMLELRGALDLLAHANKKLVDAHALLEHEHAAGRDVLPRSEYPRLNKVYNESFCIISRAASEVAHQLKAMLGKSKEYNQASVLRDVK